MEIHSQVAAKKLWNYLRIAFLMLRKGLISKTKFFMDINLKLQRGKLAGKNLANLMFHHHHQPVSSPPVGFYEFSCSNTPNPILLNAPPKRRSIHFPCIHATATTDKVSAPAVMVGPEFFQQLSALAAGERPSPLQSPFSARGSNCSGEAESEELGHVDVDAEQFIKKFYEQLNVQSRIALLQSPGMVISST